VKIASGRYTLARRRGGAARLPHATVRRTASALSVAGRADERVRSYRDSFVVEPEKSLAVLVAMGRAPARCEAVRLVEIEPGVLHDIDLCPQVGLLPRCAPLPAPARPTGMVVRDRLVVPLRCKQVARLPDARQLRRHVDWLPGPHPFCRSVLPPCFRIPSFLTSTVLRSMPT
jgi:hypothetical protein